jgi:hypothetical protein
MVDFFVSDVPSDVAIQLAREEHIIRKCLLRERDDEEPDEVGLEDSVVSEKITFDINHTDPFIFDVVRDLARMIVAKHGDLKTGFHHADDDKDGLVSTKEFRKFLKSFEGIHAKLTDEEIDIVVDALDYNNNGKIEISEFEKLGHV